MGERKEKITIRLKKRVIERLREMDNYNKFIEDLIEEKLKKKD